MKNSLGKRVLLFSLACFFAGMIIFWESIATSGLQWGVKKYCERCFGGELNVQSIRRQKNLWILEKPQVVEKGSRTLIASADKVKIEFERLSGWPKIKLSVNALNPGIHLDSKNTKQMIGHVSSHGQNIWPKIIEKICQTNFAVQKGFISWNDERAEFQLNSDEVGTKLSLAFNQSNKSSNYLEADFKNLKGFLGSCEFDFQAVEVPPLVALAQVCGFDSKGWCALNGQIDGKFSVYIPTNGNIRFAGDSTIKNFVFHDESNEVRGEIKAAKFKLKQPLITTLLENKKSSLLGKLDFVEDASLKFYKKGHPFWEIKHIRGGINFEQPHVTSVNVMGRCVHNDRKFLMQVGGHIHNMDDENLALDLTCSASSQDKKDASIQLSANRFGASQNRAEIKINHVSHKEFAFVKEVLERRFPFFKTVHVMDGIVNGTGVAYFQAFKVQKVQLEKLEVEQLVFDVQPWVASGEISKSFGKVSFDLSQENPIKTLNGQFKVEDGELSVICFDDKKWDFTGINTDLRITNGVIEKSVLYGEFSGLYGSAALDWNNKEKLIEFDFKGDVSKLGDLVPFIAKEHVLEVFSKDHLVLTGDVLSTPMGAEIRGNLKVTDPERRQIDTFDFGFHLEKISRKLWKSWPPTPIVRTYWDDIGLEILQKSLPTLAAPTAILKVNWMKRETGIAGFVMRNGWFKGNDLPVEKYVSPFLFPDKRMVLTGVGHFEGVFDHKRLDVSYSGDSVQLENEHFLISTPQIKKKGVHYFDFDQGLHYGSLPLENASYMEKTSGLEFPEIDAFVTFGEEKIYLKSSKTICGNLCATGDLEIDFETETDPMSLLIRLDSLNGKLSDLKELLSSSRDFSFIPEMDGNIELNDQGARFQFTFNPSKCDVAVNFHGRVSNGYIKFEELDAEVDSLSLNFDYESLVDQLKVSEVQGALYVGNDKQETYTLVADHILIDQQKEADFDLWIGDSQRDLIRLVGQTKWGDDGLSFDIDNTLTHVGDVHPRIFQLKFNRDFSVKTFQLDLQYRLETLLTDLQRISRSGALFLSENLLEAFNEFKQAEGEFELSVYFEPEKKQYHYDINGQNVVLGSLCFETSSLSGKKIGNQFLVEKCYFDDISLTANLVYNPEHYWDIQSIVLNYDDIGVLGISGRYLEESYSLESHIQQLSIDLGHINQIKGLSDQMESLNIKGVFSGQGDVSVNLNQKNGKIEVTADLETSVSNWSYNGLIFDDVNRAKLKITPNDGVTLQQFNTAIKSSDEFLNLVKIDLAQANYSFSLNSFQIADVEFEVPAKHLEQTVDLFALQYPEQMTETVTSIVKESKKKGSLRGHLKADYSKEDFVVDLLLDDGKYHFNRIPYSLKQFQMHYDSDSLKISTQYMHGSLPLFMVFHSYSSDMQKGDLRISQKPLQNSKEHLTIKWERDPLFGFLIQKVSGKVCGIEPHLVLDHEYPINSDKNHLVGTVVFNGREASRLFTDTIRNTLLDWKVGRGYRLQGKFTVLKQQNNNELSHVAFNGTLEGERIELNGYQFDSFVSNIEFEPTRMTLHNLFIKDHCGTMHTDRIDLYLTDDDFWFLSVPLLKVNQFRPSLLREPGTPLPAKIKPLVIKDLELVNFQGYVADAKTFRGHGKFEFTNRSKKVLQNTIFQIPTDILSRIGLDPAVMTPVEGGVLFEVDDAKFHLTKFKDVQSEGKLSKFYLAGNNYDSYLDFDGNLHVRVSMKQYTLLFKLAELFTVTIQGGLSDPIYKMQGKKRKSKYTASN